MSYPAEKVGTQADWLRDPLPQVSRKRVDIALVDVPRAANTDPQTSHAAAKRIKSTGALKSQQELVLGAVLNWPGSTSAELADKLAGDGKTWRDLRHMVARRLPELAGVHIDRGEARVCRVTQAKCVTWWPR